MKNLLYLIILIAPSYLFSQGKVSDLKIEMSSDTIGMDGTLEVSFIVENAKLKKLNPPSFEGFEAQGPSVSSMMSIVNGDMTQKTTYTFYLTPTKKGKLKIGSASADTEGGELKSEEASIVVLEHYEPVAKPKRQNKNPFGDDDDDYFFRRPKQKAEIPQRTPEKTKKKYDTEKI